MRFLKGKMIYILIFILTVIIFQIGEQVPLGIEIGVLYSSIIFLTIPIENKYSSLYLGAILTVLTIFGFHHSPARGELWKTLFNFFFSLTLIWIMVGILLKRKFLELRNIELDKSLNNERNMFLDAPVVIFKWQNNEGWPIEYVSSNVETILGYTAGEFLNQDINYSDIIDKAYIDKVMEEVADAVSRRVNNFTHNPYKIIKKNGDIIFVSGHTSLMYDGHDNITHFLGYITNISHNLEIENALIESENKFRMLADYTLDWEYWVQPDGQYKYVSPSCKDICGYSNEELIENPKLFFNIIHPEYKGIMKKHFYVESLNKEKYSKLELVIITKTGENKWIEHFCTPIHNNEGLFLGRRCSNRDISHRKYYEAELGKFNILVDQGPFSIVLTDLKGNIKYVNRYFEKLTGYVLKDIIGKHTRIFNPEDTDLNFDKKRLETLEKGHTWKGETQSKKKNGELFWESISITPLTNSRGKVFQYMAVKEDITEKKSIQNQLYQSQKMEAIGQFAGGIAHDFNNILTAILGFAEIGLMENKDDQFLVEIQSSSLRAANLVKKLLGFSRKQIIEPTVLNVKQLIDDLQRMLKRIIGEDLQIYKSFKDNLPLIFADPGQVEQIIVNLVVNARDAINSKKNQNDKKLITIGLDRIKINTPKQKNMFKISIGSYLIISISDTGTGMDKDTQNKIFEPFFTTKEKGKGTGLGLSTVFGIIKQNNGFITVYSEVSVGTTFNIYWPVIENDKVDKTGDIEHKSPIAGTQTIVLVEDDENIIGMLEKYLEKLGYTVISFLDPVVALEKIPKLQFHFDLLITDIIMPHMNGKEFAEKLSLLYPKLKILYTSGYTGDHITNNAGILIENINYISKPYNLVELTEKISELIKNT